MPIMSSPGVVREVFTKPGADVEVVSAVVAIVLPSAVTRDRFFMPLSETPSEILPTLDSSLVHSTMVALRSAPVPVREVEPTVPKDIVIGRRGAKGWPSATTVTEPV